MPPDDTPKPGFHFDPNARCAACGAFGAFPFSGEALCTDCYAARGSCCAEALAVPESTEDDSVPATRSCAENKKRSFE